MTMCATTADAATADGLVDEGPDGFCEPADQNGLFCGRLGTTQVKMGISYSFPLILGEQHEPQLRGGRQDSHFLPIFFSNGGSLPRWVSFYSITLRLLGL